MTILKVAKSKDGNLLHYGVGGVVSEINSRSKGFAMVEMVEMVVGMVRWKV